MATILWEDRPFHFHMNTFKVYLSWPVAPDFGPRKIAELLRD